MQADQFSLRRLLNAIRNAQRQKKPFDRNLGKLTQQLKKSIERRKHRASLVPKINWPDELPVVGRRQEIAEAVRDHQVVVVCG